MTSAIAVLFEIMPACFFVCTASKQRLLGSKRPQDVLNTKCMPTTAGFAYMRLEAESALPGHTARMTFARSPPGTTVGGLPADDR